jgi:hypothetical protein
MEYFNYLLKNRSVLLFVIFVNVFTLGLLSYLSFSYEYVVDESSPAVFAILITLLLAIFIAGNLQPYKEWKNGINRKSK